MASVVIGSAIGAKTSSKVLQRQNFSKEPNGLETIIEAYSILTSNRDTVVPEKGTLHSAFSSSTKTYTRMAVESVNTEEQDGGITQMLVTYVGLTTLTGLPPPIVRLIPTASAGLYGPPLVIEAEYVTDVSETQFMAGQLTVSEALSNNSLFRPTIKMPSFINEYEMPKDPRPPFSSSNAGGFFQYGGYCVLSVSCDRQGIFLVARNTYHENFQSAQIIQGTLQ
jgi:hypothetical protein